MGNTKTKEVPPPVTTQSTQTEFDPILIEIFDAIVIANWNSK